MRGDERRELGRSRTARAIAGLSLALPVLFAGCDGGTSNSIVRTLDQQPVCVLATPLAVPCGGARTRVLLDATGSYDPDDPSALLAFRWRSNCPESQWLFPSPGRAVLELFGCNLTCTVELTVTSGPLSTRCTVPVVVIAPSTYADKSPVRPQAPPPTFADRSPVRPNEPPICDAGPAQLHECPGSLLLVTTLDGSASYDPDGAQLTYRWSTPAAGASFDDPTSVRPMLRIPLGVGCGQEFEVNLTVDDGTERSSCSTFLQVQPPNLPPPGGDEPARPANVAPAGAPYLRGAVTLAAVYLPELGAVLVPGLRLEPGLGEVLTRVVAAGFDARVRVTLPWSVPVAAAWPTGLPPSGLLLLLDVEEARALVDTRTAALLREDPDGVVTDAWPLRLEPYSPSTKPSERKSTASPASR